MSARRARGPLALTLVLLLAAMTAYAGVDVSMGEELERLDALRTLLEDIEAANSEEDLQVLQDRWTALQARLESARAAPEGVRRRVIHNLDEALSALTDDVEQLREEVTRYFPKARNRVAVFTFDDPDGLAIGDDLSFILSKQLLFSTRARSFAVVNFQQGVAPQRPGALAYFDKVERLTRDQGYSLALWGRLARTRDGVRVSLFGQAFPRLEDGQRFAYRVALSTPRGEQWLTAALTADRFKLADITLSSAFVARLPALAEEVRTLRASPRSRARSVGELSAQAPHYIADSRGDWVRMQVRGGTSGWTSVRALCPPDCDTLLDAISFANEIVAAGDGRAPRAPAASLAPDTQVVFHELSALHELANGDYAAARAYAERGSAGTARTAGFGNISTVARLAERLERSSTIDAPALISLADSLRDTRAPTPEAHRNARLIADAVPSEEASVQEWRTKTARRDLLVQRRWALVLGVNRYQHLGERPHGASDARRIAEVLRHSGYRVELLLDPNRLEVERGLRAHAGDAQIVVYAGGHLRLVDGTPSLLLPGYDPAAPVQTNAAIPLSTLATGEGERALVLDGDLSEPVRAALPDTRAHLMVDLTQRTTSAVEIGAGPFAYFFSRSLRRDQETGGDGLITLHGLASRMNADAARLGVPLRAHAISSSTSSRAHWVATPRDSAQKPQALRQ